MKNIFKLIAVLSIIGAGLAIGYILFINSYVPSGPKNILLITATSLRSDHLSCYGYPLISTKTIDKLAKQGILFEKTYCNSPLAIYGHGSILAGKNSPSVILKRGDSINLDQSYKTLAEYLKDKGYSTAAITSNPFYVRNNSFNKGFDLFNNVTAKLKQDQFYLRGKNLTGRLIEELNTKKADAKPFFIWAEYSLPLPPFNSAEKQWQYRKTADSDYDTEIMFLDDQISRIITELQKLRLDKRTIIVFTATNGESLSEHKEPVTGIFVYESTMRVPLIFKIPGVRSNRVVSLATHSDILPTILNLAEISFDAKSFDGISLVPQIKGDIEEKDRNVYLESLTGSDQFGWSPVVGMVSSDGYKYDFKYIELPEPELYDLTKDPHEIKNIASTSAKKRDEMSGKLKEYLKDHRPQLLDAINKGEDPKKNVPLIASKPPKTKDVELIISYYKDLLKSDPDNKTFKFFIATLYFVKNDFESAKNYLTEVVEKDPYFNKGWELLGSCYAKQDNIDKAIECYEKALSIYSEMPSVLNNLAWYYAQKNIKLDEALKYANKANEMVENYSAFIDTLAEVYLKMGDKNKALELLDKAFYYDPGSEYIQTRIRQLKGKGSSITSGSSL